MKIFWMLVVAAVTIAGLAAGLWHFMPGFQSGLGPAKIIQVKAYLDNRCDIDDSAFVAYAPAQNRTARFHEKIAIMRLPETAKIQLSISSAYPNFKYDDVPQDVASEVVLVADCNISPRLRSIFGSMTDKFKQQ